MDAQLQRIKPLHDARSLVCAAGLALLVFGGACLAATPEQVEKPAPVPNARAWQRSDVLLSPRFFRPDWRQAFESYGATRIVWTQAGPQYVAAAQGAAKSVQCQFPPWVPKQRPGWEQMACHKQDGTFVQWKFGDGNVLVFPDTNSPAWRSYMQGEVEKLVAAGCRDFQQDDPGMNFAQIKRGGCYPSDGTVLPLKDREPFQRQSTEAYYKWLHETTRSLVQAHQRGAEPIFSANMQVPNFEAYPWVASSFDNFVAEIAADRETTPAMLLAFYGHAKERPAPSAVTFPTNDVWRIRRATASAYALGLLPVVPWDVFTGMNSPRFFGDPATFADQFKFVRKNPLLFDPYDHGDAAQGSLPGIYLAHGHILAIDRTSGDGTARVQWAPYGQTPDLTNVSTVRIADREFALRGPAPSADTLIVADAPALRVGMPVFFGRSRSIVSLRRAQAPSRELLHLALWDELRPPAAVVLDGQRAVEFSAATVLRPGEKATGAQAPTAGAGASEDKGYVVYPLKSTDEWVMLLPRRK